MVDADEHDRCEISPSGVLSSTPLPGSAHAVIVSRLLMWLVTGGLPADRVTHAVGLRIPGRRGGVGGRVPDLIVWSKTQAEAVWLPVTDVQLVVEAISPGSEEQDTVTKRAEYAAAGIPQYWTVDQDSAQTVTMHHLTGDHYAVRASMPLAWVLNTSPSEHDLA